MIGLKLKLIMNKWIVRYNDKDGDSCSVWTEANSKDEALKRVSREYWDMYEIISCSKVK